MEENTKKALVMSALKIAAENGYTAYAVKNIKEGYRTYGFIVTPQDNVLYIQAGDFGGIQFSLKYRPSVKCGSGCRCNTRKPNKKILGDEPDITYDVSKEVLEYAERDGLSFARSLKAQLFASSEEWMKQYWEKDALERIQ